MTATLTRDGARLALAGPITMETAGGLAAQARALIAASPDPRPRVLDLCAVTALDSAAVSLVLELARDGGAALTVERAPASFASLAALYGVSELVGNV